MGRLAAPEILSRGVDGKLNRRYGGFAGSPSEAPPPSSALLNSAAAPAPATTGVERNVTKPFIQHAEHAVCPASPKHGPTALDIQRWEDDGGAVFPDITPRSKCAEHHIDDRVVELAAAE